MKYFLLVLLLSLTTQAKELSNELPLEYVKQLFQVNLWDKAFDQQASLPSQDLRGFWTALKTDSVNANQIAEKVFNPVDSKNGFIQYPLNYQQKIALLRFLEDNATAGVSQARVEAIIQALTFKYFSLSVSLIRLARISEYDPILNNLKNLIQSHSLTLVDLSPERRKNLSDAAAQSGLHAYMGTQLTSQHDGHYEVNGLYLDSKKLIAIDLSRPIAETAVTLAHEVVHAADPEIQNYKKTAQDLTPQVIDILKKHLTLTNPDRFVQAIIIDVYRELGRVDMMDLFDQIRAERLATLSERLKDTDSNLLHSEVLAKWTRAIIGATIENEYKAYTMSLAFYSQVRNSYRIFPASTERELFMKKLFHHDTDFAKSLSLSMNPFNKGTNLNALVGTDRVSPESKMEVNKLKNVLEYQYLQQSQNFISEVSNKYAAVLKLISPESKESDGRRFLEPEWTQPGKFESPTNPYVVLTAKISTSWVLRFKQGVQQLVDQLRAIHEPLLTMRAGVFDLHDITFGELKLMGLQPMDARPENLPQYISQDIRADFNSVPDFLKANFTDTMWVPDGDFTKQSIPQATAFSNLIRFRLLKAVYWLREDFPPSVQNIAAIKVFQQKLHEGLYDQDEITPERAEELKKELAASLIEASIAPDQTEIIRYLMEALTTFHFIAEDAKWAPIAREFDQRIQEAKLMLFNMGVENTMAVQDVRKYVDDSTRSFMQQVATHYAACAKTETLDFDSEADKTTVTQFTLGEFKFPLTAMCHERNLYVLRQPGDYKRSAPTRFAKNENGQLRPHTVIFSEGRPVILEPFIDFPKANQQQPESPKRSNWFNQQ